MLAPPIPKYLLPHTIIYEPYNDDTDDYGDSVPSISVTINNVRVDLTTVFSRDNTQSKIVAEAVVFVDAVNSNPITEFIEQSKITFNGKDYTLKKVVPCYQLTSDAIHHYELEVI